MAIHTYEKAVMLKTLLENEGVPVVLHNVNLEEPIVSSGVRVRIKEKDLPLALRIIENIDIFAYNDPIASQRQQVLVPIDFADYTFKAIGIAFNIAKANKTSVIFFHSFIDPHLSGNIQLSNPVSYDIDISDNRKRLEQEATDKMKDFEMNIKEKIKRGEIPPVKFTSIIREGVAEDAITEYAKQSIPMIIVMATREAKRKDSELIGSVTAEVMDSCRFPVISIPENNTVRFETVRKIVFVCNLDQTDILAIDTLNRILPDISAEILLLNIYDKRQNTGNNIAMKSLIDYCNRHYPSFAYSSHEVNPRDLTSNMSFNGNILNPDLIIVPNKRKNIFTRLFNPSIAHKVLFNADVPMMVIPV